jgi:putative endonuclease
MSRRATIEQEWFFYIVRCKDNSLYSGITNDLDDRVREHNQGTGARYTLARRPVTLVYSEKYSNSTEARKREGQIKGWSKVKKELLIKGFPRLHSE